MVLGTGEHKTFKFLRRMYISRLASQIGVENTRMISGHSGISVMEGHYLHPETLAINETTKNMTILGTPKDTRLDELKSIRKQPSQKTIER